MNKCNTAGNFVVIKYDDPYHAGVISFKAGPAIFLNKHATLEITAGYSYSTRGPSALLL